MRKYIEDYVPPRWGGRPRYCEEFKRIVVAYAELYGHSEAAQKYGVCRATADNWQRVTRLRKDLERRRNGCD